MTEAESKEVEKILLHIADARTRTQRAVKTLNKDGGARHVVDALRRSEEVLGQTHRTLMQETYYAVGAVPRQR